MSIKKQTLFSFSVQKKNSIGVKIQIVAPYLIKAVKIAQKKIEERWPGYRITEISEVGDVFEERDEPSLPHESQDETASEDRFLIFARTRGPVGSFPVGSFALWWRPNGNGYTTDIGRAGRFTLEEAGWRINNPREHAAIPEHEALNASYPVVDFGRAVSLTEKNDGS